MLVEQMDGLQVSINSEGTDFTWSGDGWSNISILPTQFTLMNQEYYDLNGLQMQDLTFFFTNSIVQEEFTPYGNQGFYLIDVVTTTPVSITEIQEASIPDVTQTRDLMGFLDSNFRSDEVVMGQQRYYHSSGDLLGQITLAGITNWGTCTSTAADRVYLTRIVYIKDAPTGLFTFQVPPVNYATTGVIAEEDSGAYQMRLHQSIQLANQQ